MFRFNFGGESETKGDLEQQAVHAEAQLHALDYQKDAEAPCTKVTVQYENSGRATELTMFKVTPPDDWCQVVHGGDSTSNAASSDLVSGTYEGGFKLWEGALDLIAVLASRMASAQLASAAPGSHVCHSDNEARCTSGADVAPHAHTFEARSNVGASSSSGAAGQGACGQRVLELGCGHGLPGIVMLLAGADVTFHDFNAEVLSGATAANVCANLKQHSDPDSCKRRCRYVSGDFKSACELLDRTDGAQKFDCILTSETVYNVASARQLLAGCAQCLSPRGYLLLASKSHYFGVGGGLATFKALVEEQGQFCCKVVRRIDDGVSNVREVLELKRNQGAAQLNTA